MKMTAEINCGDGAAMTIVDPRSFEDGGVGWKLRYGNPDDVRYTAASLIDSYDYLLSSNITSAEAIRRLRLLRAGRQALATSNGGERQDYLRRIDELGRFTYVLGPDRWNEEYRLNLAKVGLTLTDIEPAGEYWQAPWPTPGRDGKPVSPDEDPYSWPVPSWIVLATRPGGRT